MPAGETLQTPDRGEGGKYGHTHHAHPFPNYFFLIFFEFTGWRSQ